MVLAPPGPARLASVVRTCMTSRARVFVWTDTRRSSRDYKIGKMQASWYLIHDRDTKFTDSFRAIVKSSHVEPLKLPARSPNLNAYAERWVKSVKDECLSKLILFGEKSLRRALCEYLTHFHTERNHQGKDNVLLFPAAMQTKNRVDGSVGCKERLGGLLKYYHRDAA